MKPSADPVYRPKRLRPRDRAVLITPGMRLLDPADREAMVARRAALADRVSAFGSLSKRRLLRNALIGGLGLPLVSLGLTDAGLLSLWIQLSAGAVFGTVVAFWRPDELLAGLLGSLVGALSLVLGTRVHFLQLAIALVAYFGWGALLGIEDQLRRTDGE